MASHWDQTLKAATKCIDEKKRLEKEMKNVKTEADRKKLQGMIDACFKMMFAYNNMLDDAAKKDQAEMKKTLESITLRKM